jgi:proteic killer suppression protein
MWREERPVINSFRNTETLEVFFGIRSKKFPPEVHRSAHRKLWLLENATRPGDLKSIGNQLERLEKDREGEWSIRINDQWRVCFKWEDGGFSCVEITDYH